MTLRSILAGNVLAVFISFMSCFIEVITTPYYLASPENQWKAIFFQPVPGAETSDPWLVPVQVGHFTWPARVWEMLRPVTNRIDIRVSKPI